jgi:AAA+ ATPase superfamily predicted ATPase
MGNPFKYGTIVTEDNFADRQKETEQLVKDLTSGQNILLYSPRRYGKTSLIVRVLDILQSRDVITAFIDLYGIISVSDLIDKIIGETVVPTQGSLQKVGTSLRKWFSNLRPEITLNPDDGSISVSFKREAQVIGEEKVLSQVLDAPQKLAESKKKPVVVVFDEFQEITNMDGVKIEKTMRSHFQAHQNVAYVFCGSKKHIIEEIFGQERRPFYKFAKPFPLRKIPKEEFFKFISKKFKETDISIDSTIVESILSFTDGHPYFTQQLCHEIWNIANETKNVQEDNIMQAVKEILQRHSDYFIRIWDSLALTQRKLIVALAKEGKVASIYSSSFIEKYDLTSASHVKKAMDYFEKEGLVERTNGTYTISDVFLTEWLKIRIG